MCEPATIGLALTGLSIVTSAATGIASYMGQAQQAQDQVNYQAQLVQARNQEILQNARLAQESYLEQVQQLNMRQQQEDEAAGQQIQQTRTDAARARATARVAAGEAGVAGLSVDALLADYFRQESAFVESVRHNREFSRQQAQQDAKGLRTQAEGRIASVTPYLPQPVIGPSFLGSALQIGTDVAAKGALFSDKIATYRNSSRKSKP